MIKNHFKIDRKSMPSGTISIKKAVKNTDICRRTGTIIKQRAAVISAAKISILTIFFSNSAIAEGSLHRYEVEAILNENLYTLEDGGTSRTGFSLVDYTDKQESGFTAATYKDNNSGEIYVVFGGTTAGENDFKDILTDAQLVISWGSDSEQLQFAHQYARQAVQHSEDGAITITGHSLGGALAMYAGANTSHPVITFNSAPYPLGANQEIDESNIVNIRSASDPLSNILTVATNMYEQDFRSEDLQFISEFFRDVDYDTAREAINSDASLSDTQRTVAIGLLDTHRATVGGSRAFLDFIGNTAGTAFIGLVRSYVGTSIFVDTDEMFKGEQIITLAGDGHSMTPLRRDIISDISTEQTYGGTYTIVPESNLVNDILSFPGSTLPEQTPGIYYNGFFDPSVNINSTSDIQDDVIQNIIEDAEPEPEPRVTLRGVLTATGDDGIVTGYASSNAGIAGPISSGSPLLRYFGFQGAESGDPDAYYDVASAGSATRPSGYSHLYWGRWRGTSYEPGGPVTCGQSGYCGITEYDGAYWLVGTPTTRSEFSLRSGSAYFDGRVRGDYDTGSSIQSDAISGDVAFEVGFSSGDVTGRFDLNRNGTAWNTLRFSGSIYERNGDTGITGDLVNVGENSQGWASGLFYGADASEVGGSFHFEDYGSGAATGIFYAHDGANGFDDPLTQVAFHTGTHQYNWDTGSYEVETNTSHSARVDSSAINDFRDGYEYTSWGTWGVDPNTGLTTGLASIEALETDSNWRSGAWVAGQTTPINDRPRSGTATYNGGAIGVSTFGDVVSGGIQMEADFARDQITADMDLYTTNGDAWVSASGSGNISDNTSNDTVTFSGNGGVTSGPGTLDFNGAFNGPNAAEASGAWVIDGTGDSAIPGAAGIFRAQN